ncbi:MAG: hypothetical protein ACE5I1_20750, partial [bacterium]
RYMHLFDEKKARFDLRMDFKRIGDPQKADEKFLASLQHSDFRDFAPKAEDYIMQEFRAISKAYLGESGQFLDFTQDDVLQRSLPLMIPIELGGQRRVYLYFHRNHSRKIEDRIGHITTAKWTQAGAQFSNPGININVAIDTKLAPNETRMLLATPPYAESVSISFNGQFERSHPDMDFWTFFDMLGHEVDGEFVRVIVTEIEEYDHIGLVYEGGDEEADKVQNSKFFLNSQLNKSNEGKKMNILKLTAAEMLELQNLLTDVADEISDFGSLSGAIEKLLETNNELAAKIKELQPKAKKLDAMLEAKREAVCTLIDKVEEGADGIKAIVKSMVWDDLEKVEKDYQAKLEKQFKIACQDCGSSNVSRRSSKEEPGGSPDGKNNGAVNQGIPASHFQS